MNSFDEQIIDNVPDILHYILEDELIDINIRYNIAQYFSKSSDNLECVERVEIMKSAWVFDSNNLPAYGVVFTFNNSDHNPFKTEDPWKIFYIFNNKGQYFFAVSFKFKDNSEFGKSKNVRKLLAADLNIKKHIGPRNVTFTSKPFSIHDEQQFKINKYDLEVLHD